MARPSHRWLAVALALIGLVTTACATVPTSGPVGRGPVVDAGESAQFIRVIAAPPSVGATPTEIVSGFLAANANFESDHAIARRYLTAQAAADWAPQGPISVYDLDSLRLTEGQRDSITAALTIHSVVQADGTLEPVDPPRAIEQEFHLRLTVEGGSGVPQWRIADPQPGVLISDLDLSRAFRRYQVFHPSARSPALVPEGRYLPVVGPSLPTALAEWVIAGPPEWLAPGVRTPAPAGTQLALDAVPVDDGVAVVDLTEQVREADDQERRDLAAQLTWTLAQVPGVVGVRLLSGGEPLAVPGVAAVTDRSQWVDRSPDALTLGPDGSARAPYYLLDGASIVRVSGSQRTSLEPAGPDLAAVDHLAVALDQSTGAVVTADRRGLWLFPLPAGPAARLVPGREVGGASFDVDGSAWYTDDGQVRRVVRGARPEVVPVDAAEISGSVSSVHLARDGARVVLVVDGAMHLGVIRSAGRGVEIVSLRRLADDVSAVRDVVWRDSDVLEVIGSLGSGGPQAVEVPVGAVAVQPLRSPSPAREIAGAPGSTTLVLTGDDQLYANLGLQWGTRGRADSVCYPG